MLTVLMNTGPWLPVPPHGYGGIEKVVATLVPELRRRDVRVLLCTVGESTLAADGRQHVFASGQLRHVTEPYNAVAGIAHAHMGEVVRMLRAHPEIDLVHDHLEVVGPAVLAAMGAQAPPVLQTLHWDLGKHCAFYEHFDGAGRIFFACVSESQKARAPAALQRQVLGVVPLATPLPADAGEHFPPPEHAVATGGHLLTLGRICRLKGYDIAARVCRQQRLPLVLAGPVAGIASAEELAAELADPASALHTAPDVRHYLDEVRPHEDGDLVRWVGSVAGAEKDDLVRSARAVLFPVRWEEPGGTAVIEALALGTPVVAMRRGVMPELIEHGVTGFLADDEDDFARCLAMVDRIDPAVCRRVAQERFSPGVMAERYLQLYEAVLRRAARRREAIPRWRAWSGHRWGSDR